MAENSDPNDELTPRELEVLKLLAEEKTNREIAEQLVLSPGTIKWYNKQIYNKLAVNSRQEAVVVAREKGILGEETAVNRPHNLPAPLTPFIGRDKEKQQLITLLTKQKNRLVTLMGAGGMGKTRLALEVGRQFVVVPQPDIFSDGIYFVALAPANNLQDMLFAIADAVQFRFYADERDPKQQILDFLHAKNELLIFDNFEHLLGSSLLVAQILQAAPQVTILVTSRERLNLSGESIFRVDGLDYPAGEAVQNPFEFSAVQLFIQSAKKVRNDFDPDKDEVTHIIQICQLLQGMPLGIILAANWVELLSPSEINHEITRNIDVLASQQRDLPQRLRSIRAVFDHSLNMMSPSEAELFMNLCVFRGGFTRQAGQAVARADLHDLISLANKSLIQHEVAEDRYTIHELLRQYAIQQLETKGNIEAIRQRHAEFFAQLAERAEPELRLADQKHWFHVLETELDNLRAAMSWSFDSDHVMPGLRITAVLRDFWFYNGYHIEGQQWCERALRCVSDDHPILRGKLRLALGLLLWARHQLEACRRNWEAARLDFKRAGNRRLEAWALGLLAGSKWGDDLTGYQSDVANLEKAIDILHKLNDKPGEAQMLNILGNVYRIPQDFSNAKIAYEACLAIVRQTGEKRREGIILSNMALIAYTEHHFKKAVSLSLDGARVALAANFKPILASCLHALAGAKAALGQPQEAARLLGVVDAYQESQGVSFAPNDVHFHNLIIKNVQQQLDAASFQAAWSKGTRISIQRAAKESLRSTRG